MKSVYRAAVSVLFLLGIFLVGVCGTSTSMAFVWPAYLVLGLAGLVSVGLLFFPVSFSPPRWTLLSVLALVAYFLVRAIDSPVAYFAREDVALIVAGFLAYAGFLSVCSTSGARRWLVGTVAALVSLNLLFALLQVLVSPSLWWVPGYERGNASGIGGLFFSEAHFGVFLGALVPLWLALLIFARPSRESRLRRRVWAVLALASTAAVLASGSANSILAMGVGLLAFSGLLLVLLWRRLRPGVRRFAFGALVAAAVGAGGLFASSPGPVLRQLGPHLVAADGGAGLPSAWRAGWKQVAESPWTGSGSRSSYFDASVAPSGKLAPASGAPRFVHNGFLQVLADYGILGLALFAAVLALHAGRGLAFVRSYRRMPLPRGEVLPRSDHLALVLGALAALAALGSGASFDYLMHLPAFAVAAAILLAVLAVPDPMAEALKKDRAFELLPGGGLIFATRSVAFGFGFALAALGAVFFRSEYHFQAARVSYAENPRQFHRYRDLGLARRLDPMNPLAMSLSARVQTAGITPAMDAPVREEMLRRAHEFYVEARRLYPQDLLSAAAHAEVLDELGLRHEARRRLDEALERAPGHGVLRLALAEHHLRHGRVSEAEALYRDVLLANTLPPAVEAKAETGLRTVAEWKLIASSRGMRWEEAISVAAEERGAEPGAPGAPAFPEARVDERAPAGRVVEGAAPGEESSESGSGL